MSFRSIFCLYIAASLIGFLCLPSLLSASKYWCDTFEDSRCGEILHDRYGLSISEYNQMSSLQKLIMQDSLDCVREDKCPLHLPSISGSEHLCDGSVSANGDGDIEGFASEYPCRNIDLLSFVSLVDLGSEYNASGNDVWGWTEYDTAGDAVGYYALSCQTDGSTIVDITDPINPNPLAFIESNVDPIRHVNWRDLKVYQNFAFIVADTSPIDDHGLQIINLPNIIQRAREFQALYKSENDIETGTRIPLYNVSSIKDGGDEDVIIYAEFGGSHNLYINDDSGYLYAVGTKTCNSGLHVVDVYDPLQPTFAGCFGDAEYVHDVECVIYHGPQIEYIGHEICFAFTPRVYALTIVDTTDKANMVELSRTEYEYSSYNHQGWVVSTHEYLLMDDELDEVEHPTEIPTQLTYIWDVRDLTNPVLMKKHDSGLTVIDHNQYIIDNGGAHDLAATLHRNEEAENVRPFKGYVFQSNYEAGVRVLNIDHIAEGDIREIAYFDNYIWKDNINYEPSDDHNNVNFRGSWSVYPYFKPREHAKEFSEVIISQNINTGLYILRTNFGLNDIFDTDTDTDDDEDDEEENEEEDDADGSGNRGGGSSSTMTISLSDEGVQIAIFVCVGILVLLVVVYVMWPHKSQTTRKPLRLQTIGEEEEDTYLSFGSTSDFNTSLKQKQQQPQQQQQQQQTTKV